MLIHHNSSMSINVCNIPSQSGGCEDHRPSARHVNFVSPFNSKPSKQLKAATPMNCVLVMFISPFLGVETGGHSLAVITTNSKDTGLLDYCRLPKQDGINTIYRHYSLNIVYAKTNILWGSHARTHARMHARTLPLCIVAIQKKYCIMSWLYHLQHNLRLQRGVGVDQLPLGRHVVLGSPIIVYPSLHVNLTAWPRDKPSTNLAPLIGAAGSRQRTAAYSYAR